MRYSRAHWRDHRALLKQALIGSYLKSKLFGLLAISVLLTSAGNSWAQRDIQEGDTAYYCEKNGAESWSERPCEEFDAKELRRGVFVKPPKAVPPPPREKIVDPATETDVVDDGKPRPIPVPAIEAANARRDEFMKHWHKSLSKLLGVAFVVAMVGKMAGRSFVFWFFLGTILHMGLVAANVLSL